MPERGYGGLDSTFPDLIEGETENSYVTRFGAANPGIASVYFGVARQYYREKTNTIQYDYSLANPAQIRASDDKRVDTTEQTTPTDNPTETPKQDNKLLKYAALAGLGLLVMG